MAGKEKQRVISLGFERPVKLENNTIYVDFSKLNGKISARAYSSEEFMFYTRTDGTTLVRSERCGATCTGDREGGYKNFVEELAKLNDARVVHDRLIEDGSGLVAKMFKATDLLEATIKELQIRGYCK